jgi:hypothetical protein
MSVVIAASLVLAVAGTAGADTCDLFNDEDRATLKVRADSADDYGYHSVLYSDLRTTVAEGWKSVSLPLASVNKDGTPFDVMRQCVETMRFYLVCKDSRFRADDDPHFQVDDVKLTKNAGGELLIDDFEGSLNWSYQQHPGCDSQTVGVSIVADGSDKVLDVSVTDMQVKPSDWSQGMNYIDLFTCTTNCATDSFVYGQDWSAYDNIEFEWRTLDPGTRRSYMELYVRTDNIIPEPVTMLGMFAGAAGLGRYLRRRRYS